MSVPIDQLDIQTPAQEIRSNLPTLDTTIDPTQFASQSGVAVADTTKSDVTTLDPPQDIDAATIGQYTPYEAVTGEVSEDATVQGRLSGLLSQDSDYIQRARENAKAFANRRGLLNSSMAAGAAEGAAIDRALPIAQQDAAAFLEQQFRNQGYSNDAARYLAEQSVQRENLQAGFEQDTRQINQQNLLDNQRRNVDAENLASREHSQAQNLAAANAAAEANRNNFAVLNADLNAQLTAIDNQAALNLEQLARSFGIMQNLDTVNGAIYQQMVAEIGTILANEKKASTAQSKINALIASAGVEFEFSTGQPVGSSGGGPAPFAAPAPAPSPPRTTRSFGLGSGPQQSCFTGNTEVTMSDKTVKEIADIQIGDIVLGASNVSNVVTGIEVPIVGSREVYSFNNGKPFVTAEHPFMTSKGWKSIDPIATAAESRAVACQPLKIGDYLDCVTGPLAELTKMDSHYFDPETPVYNLILNGNHTYYANGFLVHNKAGD